MRDPRSIDWKFIVKNQPSRKFYRALERVRMVSPYSTRIHTDPDGYSFRYFRFSPFPTPEQLTEGGVETFDVALKQKGDIAVDVGSHVGSYAVRLAKNFREVHAFEPNPRTFDLLYENIQRNHSYNIIPNHLAVSDVQGSMILRVPKRTIAGSSIAPSHYGWVKFTDSVKVDAVSLDYYFARRPKGKIDFVKIDVENHELAVLKGMEKIISRDRPLMSVEVHQRPTTLTSCQCNVCEWMRGKGLQVELHGRYTPEMEAHWLIVS